MRPHKLKWFVSPILSSKTTGLEDKLKVYTKDLNFVLAKTTKRRLVYDGVIIKSDRPYSFQPPIDWTGQINKLPTVDFDFYHFIEYSPDRTTGFAAWNYDGTAVSHCSFDSIENPIPSNPKYNNHIYVLLHEYAHNFGCGIGEYYRTAIIPDRTGEMPILNVSTLDNRDRYWALRGDFLQDPLLRNQSSLSKYQFSSLTSTVVNSGKYRISSNPIEISDYNDVSVIVVDKNEKRINGARVDIWSGLKSTPSMYSRVLTDESGKAAFSWGVKNAEDMSSDPVRLIKIYHNDYLSAATHITLWDHQYEFVCRKRKKLAIKIVLLKNGEWNQGIEDKIVFYNGGPIGWSVGPTLSSTAEDIKYKKEFYHLSNNAN